MGATTAHNTWAQHMSPQSSNKNGAVYGVEVQLLACNSEGTSPRVPCLSPTWLSTPEIKKLTQDN